MTPGDPFLSVLVPCYNEEATVARAVKGLLEVDFPVSIEVVAVDDGSTDDTLRILRSFDDGRLRVIAHEKNAGKGAAIRTAAQAARGECIVPYDADLEYDPADLTLLVQAIISEKATVVFGTRSFGSHTAYSYWYVMGNKVVTTTANILNNAYISDVETCYKMLPRELFLSLDIREEGFGMEAEIVGKLLGRGIRPYEIPITYSARSREEGKKITWQDGVQAVWILGKTRAATRRQRRKTGTR